MTHSQNLEQYATTYIIKHSGTVSHCCCCTVVWVSITSWVVRQLKKRWNSKSVISVFSKLYRSNCSVHILIKRKFERTFPTRNSCNGNDAGGKLEKLML